MFYHSSKTLIKQLYKCKYKQIYQYKHNGFNFYNNLKDIIERSNYIYKFEINNDKILNIKNLDDLINFNNKYKYLDNIKWKNVSNDNNALIIYNNEIIINDLKNNMKNNFELYKLNWFLNYNINNVVFNTNIITNFKLINLN
jgi:DNA repair protein RadC